MDENLKGGKDKVKRIYVIVAFFVIILMIILPIVSVVESNILKDEEKASHRFSIIKFNINMMTKLYKNNQIEPTFFILFLLLQLIRLLRIFKLWIIWRLIKRLFKEKPDKFWWNSDWLFRKQITIDHTKVEGNLSNFPVLVSHTSSDFVDKAQVDGDDFLFAYINGSTQIQLCHEIEYYNNSFGELVTWVNIPFVRKDKDTVFYLYYGNPDCNDQQNAEGVWNRNYSAVYHMDQILNGVIDSTINNRDSTNFSGRPVYRQEGIAAYAVDFDDVDTINIPHNFNLGSSDITLEVWINANSWPEYGGTCTALSFVGEHYLRCANYRNKYGEDELRGFGYCIEPNGLWNNLIVKFNPPKNLWIYIAGAYDNDIGAAAFYDAELQITDSSNGNLRERSLISRIGRNFSGLVDEIRVSNIRRSDYWIKTTYNSIKNPLNFLSFGPEEKNLFKNGFKNEKN